MDRRDSCLSILFACSNWLWDQLARGGLRSAEPGFGQMWDDPVRPVVLYGSRNRDVLPSHSQSQRFDMEECIDGVGLTIFPLLYYRCHTRLQGIHVWIGMLPAIGIGRRVQFSYPAIALWIV